MTLRKRTTLVAACAAIITFAVYLPALRNGFVNWDDDRYIVGNPHIRSLGVDFFRWAFTDASVDYWQPIPWISHGIAYALFGPGAAGHHLVNLLFHGINAFLVVWLVVRLLSIRSGTGGDFEARGTAPVFTDGGMLIAGAVTGILFGLHPLHVESVAWVTERKDVLYAFFTLLATTAYLSSAPWGATPSGIPSGRQTSFGNEGYAGRRQYMLALVYFVLALASKPMAVTLPAVFLIIDWYPLGRIHRLRDGVAAFFEKVPFFALSAAVSLATLLQQRSHASMSSLQEVTLLSRITTAADVLTAYLGKIAAPLHLLPLYPVPARQNALSAGTVLAIGFIAVITALCLFAAKRSPVFLAAWVYFVVTLLPILGFIRVGAVIMADRFMYLPSLSIFLLAGLGASLLCSRIRPPAARILTASAAVLLIAAMAFLTVMQIGIWKDGVSLWTQVINEEPYRVPLAYVNRGVLLAKAGRLDEALQDFSAGIALNHEFDEAYMNRGIVLGQSGRCLEALDDFNAALKIAPSNFRIYLNRAAAYECTGELEHAVEDYGKALSLNPDFPVAYVLRGELFLKQGKTALAGNDFRTACDKGSDEGCDSYRKYAL